MKRYEYLKVKLCNIPDRIIQLYKLRNKATPYSIVYLKIRKGMYGLPQAVLIANKLLGKRLAKHEYTQSKIVTRLRTHKWRPIQFTLILNDFGVKYLGK